MVGGLQERAKVNLEFKLCFGYFTEKMVQLLKGLVINFYALVVR